MLASIDEQGKLTDELRAHCLAATEARLEDIYLPYNPSAGPSTRWPARPASTRSPTAARQPRRVPRCCRGGLRRRVEERARRCRRTRRRPRVLVAAGVPDLISDLRQRLSSRGRRRPASPRGQGDRGGRASDSSDFSEPFPRCRPPGPRHAARRGGGDPHADGRPGAANRPAGDGDDGAYGVRAGHRPPVRISDQGRPGRRLARRHRPLGLADQGPRPPRHRRAHAPAQGSRGRRRARLRRQPARPAARGTRRPRRRWGSTPASAPASSSPSSTRTGKVVATTSSTRMCRSASGTSRSAAGAPRRKSIAWS